LGQGFDELFRRADALEAESRQPSRRALASLLDVGQDVVVGRGYHGTRVDDVVAAAGVSHGAFYRYFENKDDLVQVVAVRALRAVSTALGAMPDGRDRPSLRRWLRRYNSVHAEQGAMIRLWVEAVDGPMRSDRAAAFDWGRRRMGRVLGGRTFGDRDVEAVVLLAVIEAFGSAPRRPVEVDAAIHVVQRGFLGLV
jgi:AcrR family transcriptional regulator